MTAPAGDGRIQVDTALTYKEARQKAAYYAGLLRSLGHGADHGISTRALHRDERTGLPDSYGIFVRAYEAEEVARGHSAA